jgi:hypothetical protein
VSVAEGSTLLPDRLAPSITKREEERGKRRPPDKRERGREEMWRSSSSVI